MASKTDVDRLMKNLFGSVLQLANMKIPCVAAVYAKGRLETFRTEQVDLININEDMFDNAAIDIHGILRYIENKKIASRQT